MDELEQRKNAVFDKVKNIFSGRHKEQQAEAVHSANTGAAVVDVRAAELWQKIKSGKSNWIYWLALVPVMIIAWFVRTRNATYLAGKYLVELDSYFFFRYARIIYETGALPAIDFLRYSPLGFPTTNFKFFPAVMAYMYKFVHLFSSMPQIEWHIYYPPVVTIISFVFFFLFVKEMFGHRTALVSTAFLTVIPAYIQRTSAGFADHEAMAMLWMFIALWLFVLMWKSENTVKSAVLGVASGIFGGFMALTWGGYPYLTISIGLFSTLSIILAKSNKNRIIGITSWAIVFYLMLSYYFDGNINLSWLRDPAIGVLFLPFLIGLIIFAGEKIKVSRFTGVLPEKPLMFAVSIVTILAVALSAGLLSLSYLRGTLVGGGNTRFGTTVAESMQAYFFGGEGWWSNFGYIILFAFLGICLMLFQMYRKEGSRLFDYRENKYGIIAALAGAVLLVSFIWSRSSPSPTFPALESFFAGTYLFWILGSAASFLLIYYYAAMRDRHALDHIFNDKNSYLLLTFSLFLVALLTSKVQIRLLFSVASTVAIACGYFITNVTQFAFKFKKGRIIAGILILIFVYVFYSSASTAASMNLGVQSMTPGQWEAAMVFLRDETPADSVVTSWWDYGHMIATVGERATVTDGGNNRGWNHASGRYFLTGKDEQSTLEYLKTHNVTHILISEEEIPKYHAFSLIGSDENMDRYSQLGIFTQQQQREVRDGTMLIYSGGWPLDKDLVMGNLIFPANQAGIGGFSITVSSDGNQMTSPILYMVYNGQQYQFGIDCMYMNGQKLQMTKTDNESMPIMKGCMVLAPSIVSQTQANAIGAAFWLSEKVYDTNFARLYMYNETDPNFKQVYADNTPLGIYQGRVIGPVKIWEVEYPAGTKTDPMYLEPSQHG